MKLNLDPALQKNYKFLNFHNTKDTISGNFPDFIIVGPQRTGTTWLTYNLRFHSQIFMSFPKELYFFSRLDQPNSEKSLHYNTFNWNTLLNSPKAFIREVAKVVFFDYLKTGSYKANELEWYLKFFELNWLSTYQPKKLAKSLHGEPFNPKVMGEATASYAAMQPEIIKELVSLNPNLKVIFMVRDPVARAWSHAKKDLAKRTFKKTSQVEEQDFIDFFNKPYQILCSRYSEQIKNWRSFLPESNILIGEYNMILSDPVKLMMSIYEFLGIETDEKYINKSLKEVINNTDTTKIPPNYKEYLENKFKDEKELLKSEFGITF